LAPNWRLKFAAGAFWLDERALHFADDLVHGTRGPNSKYWRAMRLAGHYGVCSYSEDVEPPGGLAQFLRAAGAPPAYLDALRRFEEADAVLQAYVKQQQQQQQPDFMLVDASPRQ
jgi:hypothetical protein